MIEKSVVYFCTSIKRKIDTGAKAVATFVSRSPSDCFEIIVAKNLSEFYTGRTAQLI